MDANRFDQIVRSLSASRTRRGVMEVLATIPLISGLAALFAEEEVDAQGRRKRRKKRHKHGRPRPNGQKKKQRCNHESKGKTCAGKCGLVKNNCKKTVDCGSCDCPAPCDPCYICQGQGPNSPAACVVDPDQQGEDCGGSDGQVCQPDGACECDAGSCAPCETCQGDGTCSLPCDGSGCCDAGTCVSGEGNGACGADGEDCIACTAPETCGGGNPGTPHVCGCTKTTCQAQGKNCGSIPDGCGNMIDCGSCSGVNTCGGGNPGTPNVCGCTPQCAGKLCTADNSCGGTCGCSSGDCCSDGVCRCTENGGFCRLSPENDVCCCTVFQQVCNHVSGGGGTCAGQ